MALPKRRQSNARTGSRRAHDKLSGVTLSQCRDCDAKIRPHAVCPKCGFYKGRRIVTIKVKEKNAKGE